MNKKNNYNKAPIFFCEQGTVSVQCERQQLTQIITTIVELQLSALLSAKVLRNPPFLYTLQGK